MTVTPKFTSLPTWSGLAAAALGLAAYHLGCGALGVVLDTRQEAVGLAVFALLLTAVGVRRGGGTGASVTRRAANLVAVGLALLTLGLLAAERLFVRAPEEVTFANGDITLKGTLYLPRGGSPPYPAVVITHGAGEQTRAEGSYYARHFARHGIAGLAFDKRGSGASGGDRLAATYDDLAADALAALRLLAQRTEIDRRQIGLWGVSEGGWVLPIAAAAAPQEVAFLIVVSTTAESPAEQVRFEVGQSVERAGHGRDTAERAMELYARTSAFERTGLDREGLSEDLRQASHEAWFEAARYLSAELPPFEQLSKIRWYPRWRKVMDFDAPAHWRRVQCPVLVLLGGSDPKIDAEKAAVQIPAALLSGGNRAATVRVFPRAEHGLVEWWLPLRLPPPRFPPGYPKLMVDWLRDTLELSPGARQSSR